MPPINDDMFGPAAPLNSEELPSIKDVICFAKHVQDNSTSTQCRKLSDTKIGMFKIGLKWNFDFYHILVNQVKEGVLEIYAGCSKYFTSPSPILQDKTTIFNNIKKTLEEASLYEKDRGDKKKRLAFIQTSTNLFNVFACKYVLLHEVFTNNRWLIFSLIGVLYIYVRTSIVSCLERIVLHHVEHEASTTDASALPKRSFHQDC